MKLIVGLGNPGKAYANNRHNVGFRCLNHLAKRHALPFDKRQFRARVATGEIAGSKVMLAKPQTYMNLSGQAVGSLMRKLNLPLHDLVVIHDDLDLPLGRTRLRPGGGSGGHKGVESIISSLASRDFPRIRVGIGRPDEAEVMHGSDEEDVVSYVLSDFTPKEKQVIEGAIAQVAEFIRCLVTEGIDSAMNRFNA
ncbi:aminoacyl-tRNA hydrolase [Chloroflexota bacterium]